MKVSTTTAWDEFSGYLLNFIRSKVPVKEDAEDILQDVFKHIHEGIGKLKEEERLKAWMFQIARNSIIDFRKQKNRDKRVRDGLRLIDEENDGAIEAMNDCMIPMIAQLPEKYREAVMLSEIDGYKQKKVAGLLGISLSGAKSRIQRGRQMLRQSFSDCCNFQLTEKGQIKEGFDRSQCKYC